MNKASGGDEIPVELFQILKDDAVKVLHSDQIRSVAQSCLTLCDPMNWSTPGLLVHHQLWSSLRLRSIEPVMPSRVGDGQGGLVCSNSWGRKESDTTERLI